MQTDLLVKLIRGASYKDAADLLESELQQSNFKVVLKDLAAVLFTSQVDKGTSLEFVIHCLLYCQNHLEATSPGLKHLLLELITPEAASQASEAVKAGAVQLFHAYCTVTDAKLAAKVAVIFKLTREDLTDWDQVTLALQQLLQSQTSYKAAVHILMQFEGLDDAIDKSEVISQLVGDGQENLCQQWVTSLGKDYQVEFIEACVALDKLKPAARAVRQLGLQAEFPNIEALYRQRSLARLVGKRLWSVALSFVGSDAALQTSLVRDMADMGEMSLAEEYRKQLGLPESVLTVDPDQVAAQEAARREQYLQIEQYIASDEQLLFVDDECGLLRAYDVLAGSDVLGLDVEWKPSHVAGVTSPAALLQVANTQAAVLFDLITLAQQYPAALDTCLQPLFSSAATLKLGFEVAGDLAKLASSWPQTQAFRHVAGVLDLKPLWVAYGVRARRQGASVRVLAAVGLSSLCKALLGKALDKSQQMSDWTARPLTTRQMNYAALDALVLPQLYDVLCQGLGPEEQQRLLQQHVQTFVRVSEEHDAGNMPSQQAQVHDQVTHATGTMHKRSSNDLSSSAVTQQSPSNTRGCHDVYLAWGKRSSETGVLKSSVPLLMSLGVLQPPTQTYTQQAPAPQGTIETAAAVTGVAADAASGDGANSSIGQQTNMLGAAAGGVTPSTSESRCAVDICAAAAQTQQEPGLPRVMALLQQHGLEDTLYWLHSEPAQVAPPKVMAAGGSSTSVSVPRSRVAKTMAVLIDHEPLLVVTRGDQRIDMHKLAAVLGVRRKVIRLAPDSMAQELTGFAPGGIPPLGHDKNVSIVIDIRLDPATADFTANNSQTVYNVYHLQASHPLLAPAAGHSDHQSVQHSWIDPGTGVGVGRACAVVAAAAVLQVPVLNANCEALDVQPGATNSCRRSAANIHSDCIHSNNRNKCNSSSGSHGEDKLYVQCGRHALAVLTFQQLLTLTEGQVADVADVPGEVLQKAVAEAAAEMEGGQQLDPHFSGGQQSAPCFLVDSMLGRLCRWLRALGVDAQFVDPGGTLQQRQQLSAADRQQQQNSLVQQIQDAAVQEGRLFITRDSKLAARRDVGGSVYLLDTDDTAQQLMEVSKHFGIRFDEHTAMSRCSNCNAAAFQLISKDDAAAHVPSRVMELVDEFWKCGKCGKVFWMGPKSYAALELLGGLFTDGRVKATPLQSLRTTNKLE